MRTVTKVWIGIAVFFFVATLVASFTAYVYSRECGADDFSLFKKAPRVENKEAANSVYCQAVRNQLHNGLHFGEPGLIAEVNQGTLIVPLPNAAYTASASLKESLPGDAANWTQVYVTHVDCDLSLVRLHPAWNKAASIEVGVRWNK